MVTTKGILSYINEEALSIDLWLQTPRPSQQIMVELLSRSSAVSVFQALQIKTEAPAFYG
jgi:hypothetical protein